MGPRGNRGISGNEGDRHRGVAGGGGPLIYRLSAPCVVYPRAAGGAATRPRVDTQRMSLVTGLAQPRGLRIVYFRSTGQRLSVGASVRLARRQSRFGCGDLGLQPHGLAEVLATGVA